MVDSHLQFPLPTGCHGTSVQCCQSHVKDNGVTALFFGRSIPFVALVSNGRVEKEPIAADQLGKDTVWIFLIT
jgi:hypothetical protein